MRQIMYRTVVGVAALMLFGMVGVLSAQQQDNVDAIVGVANASLEEVSIHLFEDPELWTVGISGDSGYSIHQRFEGGPGAKTPLDDALVDGSTDLNVLGVKTEFLRRGFTEIVFEPFRPIPIRGLVSEISLWVAGRDLPHELYILVRDIDGRVQKVFVDRLNFRGWQQVTAQIPSYTRLSEGLYTGVKQYDPRQPRDSGLELVALVVEPLFTEAYGTYYVYFDDMRALTDLSPISSDDPDDIADTW